MRTVVLVPQVKMLVACFEHSPSFQAEVKNGWCYISVSPIRLVGMGEDKLHLHLSVCVCVCVCVCVSKLDDTRLRQIVLTYPQWNYLNCYSL